MRILCLFFLTIYTQHKFPYPTNRFPNRKHDQTNKNYTTRGYIHILLYTPIYIYIWMLFFVFLTRENLNKASRYKLRMFGIPIEGTTNVLCDNEAVFKNMTMPDSTLKKKHTSICYHQCREVVASETIWVAKEGTLTNLSDLFTKPLPQVTREGLLDWFTY